MKKLEIRELEFDDVYDVAEILGKIDIKVSEEARKAEEEGNELKMGILVIKDSLADVKNAKKEINEFLGSLFGISGEEFGNLSMKESVEALKQVKNLDGISDFFDSVKSLMK